MTKQTTNVTRQYIDGIEYLGSTIDLLHTETGAARNNAGTYTYEFFLKDHLGNTRIVYNNGGTVLQQADFYPFGMDITRYQAVPNKYLYNGKEKQEELNQYDYGARFYDPVVGRWHVVDPMSEKGRRWSPFVYAFNNAIRYIDPDGAWPWPIWVRSFISASSVAGGDFRGDGRGASTSTDRNTTTSRAFVNFTYDPQKLALTNKNVDADNTVMYAPKEAGMGDRYPLISKKPDPTATFTKVSTEKNSLGNDIGSFGLDYSAKDPVTPGFATPSLDVHSNFSMTENLKMGTLSVNATFTGDVFPSTEAFISDQSGAKLFLGASKETGGIGDLFGDNKKPLFNVNMQIKFDAKGNFIGVQQGNKLINVADWNKKIQEAWDKK